MAWTDTQTNLSTVEQLQDNLPAVLSSAIADELIQKSLDAADEEVYDDLSKYVDWDEMEALDAVPRVLNRLAQYKTVQLVLIRSWRAEEDIVVDDTLANSILKEYKDKYDKLMTQVVNGDIIILDSANEEIEQDVMRKPGVGRII